MSAEATVVRNYIDWLLVLPWYEYTEDKLDLQDAEKVLADGDRVTRIDRQMPSAEARGEYIGVAKFSQAGAACLREHYHRVRREFAGRQWKGGTTFEKAYLIHLFEEMLDQSVSFHMVATDGEYMEIDTEEDYALANERWPREFGGIDH